MSSVIFLIAYRPETSTVNSSIWGETFALHDSKVETKMAPLTRIAELASIIQFNAMIVDQFISSKDLPTPSFGIKTPPELDLPAKIVASQSLVIEAMDELHALLLGPMETIFTEIVQKVRRAQRYKTKVYAEWCTAQITDKSTSDRSFQNRFGFSYKCDAQCLWDCKCVRKAQRRLLQNRPPFNDKLHFHKSKGGCYCFHSWFPKNDLWGVSTWQWKKSSMPGRVILATGKGWPSKLTEGIAFWR